MVECYSYSVLVYLMSALLVDFGKVAASTVHSSAVAQPEKC